MVQESEEIIWKLKEVLYLTEAGMFYIVRYNLNKINLITRNKKSCNSHRSRYV